MVENTQFGFKWGPLEVTRVCDSERASIVAIETKQGVLDIYVTPKGYIRVLNKSRGFKVYKP